MPGSGQTGGNPRVPNRRRCPPRMANSGVMARPLAPPKRAELPASRSGGQPTDGTCVMSGRAARVGGRQQTPQLRGRRGNLAPHHLQLNAPCSRQATQLIDSRAHHNEHASGLPASDTVCDRRRRPVAHAVARDPDSEAHTGICDSSSGAGLRIRAPVGCSDGWSGPGRAAALGSRDWSRASWPTGSTGSWLPESRPRVRSCWPSAHTIW
jgi:hypothetical protein